MFGHTAREKQTIFLPVPPLIVKKSSRVSISLASTPLLKIGLTNCSYLRDLEPVASIENQAWKTKLLNVLC